MEHSADVAGDGGTVSDCLCRSRRSFHVLLVLDLSLCGPWVRIWSRHYCNRNEQLYLISRRFLRTDRHDTYMRWQVRSTTLWYRVVDWSIRHAEYILAEPSRNQKPRLGHSFTPCLPLGSSLFSLLSSLVSRLSSLFYKRITHLRPICTVSSYLNNILLVFHDLDKRYGKPNLLLVWCTSSLNGAHGKVTTTREPVMGHDIKDFPKFTVPWRSINYNMRGLEEISAMPLHPSFFFVPVDSKKRAKELWTCTDWHAILV